MKNTGMRGDAALLLVSAKLVEAGITLLKPISESLRFDLVILYDKVFYKVQVKRAYRYNNTNRFKIDFRTIIVKTGENIIHKYNEDEIDFIIGVVVDTNDLYCFPMKDVLGRNSIQVDPLKSSAAPSPNKKINPELYKNKIMLNNMECKLGGPPKLVC